MEVRMVLVLQRVIAIHVVIRLAIVVGACPRGRPNKCSYALQWFLVPHTLLMPSLGEGIGNFVLVCFGGQCEGTA